MLKKIALLQLDPSAVSGVQEATISLWKSLGEKGAARAAIRAMQDNPKVKLSVLYDGISITPSRGMTEDQFIQEYKRLKSEREIERAHGPQSITPYGNDEDLD